MIGDPSKPQAQHPLANTDYTVTLEAFEGPLDLLLYLIRKAEVDIHDIPVSRITEQYMLLLKQIDRVDIEAASEFLVMAATLMEIKSRMLTPLTKPTSNTDAPIEDHDRISQDPRAELVRQLLAYKKVRDAATILEERLETWERRLPAAAAARPAAPVSETDDESTAIDLGDLSLTDLVAAFSKIVETVDLNRVGEHRVLDDETPIELHAADIEDQLTRFAEPLPENLGGHGVSFRRLFTGRRKSEAVGLFLAMLELMKQNKLTAHQDSIDGEIYLRIRGETPLPASTTFTTAPSPEAAP
jgi:segregation and condensation protein A